MPLFDILRPLTRGYRPLPQTGVELVGPAQQEIPFLYGIPEDIIVSILMYLHARDIIRFAKTCNTANKISLDSIIWKHLYAMDFPDYRLHLHTKITKDIYVTILKKFMADILGANVTPKQKSLLKQRLQYILTSKSTLQTTDFNTLLSSYNNRPIIVGFSRNQDALSDLFRRLSGLTLNRTLKTTQDKTLLALLCNQVEEFKKYFNNQTASRFLINIVEHYLLYATWLGYFDIVQIIVELRNDLDLNKEIKGTTVLELALIERHYHIVEFFLSLKTNQNYIVKTNHRLNRWMYLLTGLIRDCDFLGVELLAPRIDDPNEKDHNNDSL